MNTTWLTVMVRLADCTVGLNDQRHIGHKTEFIDLFGGHPLDCITRSCHVKTFSID